MKARLVNETIHSNIEPKEEFLDWLDRLVDQSISSGDEERWDLIIDRLVNDESSSDEEMMEYFIENGVKQDLAAELLFHRNGFLNYGLDIPQY